MSAALIVGASIGSCQAAVPALDFVGANVVVSQIEIWQALSGLRLRSRPVPVRDGIDRLRTFLQDPASGTSRLWIDPYCRALLREFGLYRYHEVVEGARSPKSPSTATTMRSRRWPTGSTIGMARWPGGPRATRVPPLQRGVTGPAAAAARRWPP